MRWKVNVDVAKIRRVHEVDRREDPEGRCIRQGLSGSHDRESDDSSDHADANEAHDPVERAPPLSLEPHPLLRPALARVPSGVSSERSL